MTEYIFLIPVYNDWQSLNLLIQNIDKQLKSNSKNANILIINDFSPISPKINLNKLQNIKEVKLINLNKNLGSQKSIAIGLKFLNEKKNSRIITIMDSDGEDDPCRINQMMEVAEKNKDYVVTSNRTNRKERFLFKSLYVLHKILTFLFTAYWISFGNFSSFHSKNLSNILKNNRLWLAYSSAVALNCKIIRLYAKRKERYFGKSQVNFLSLILHSFRVISVFWKNVIIFSLTYVIIFLVMFYFFNNILNIIFILMIIIFNFILQLVRYLNKKEDLNNWKDFIANTDRFI